MSYRNLVFLYSVCIYISASNCTNNFDDTVPLILWASLFFELCDGSNNY